MSVSVRDLGRFLLLNKDKRTKSILSTLVNCILQTCPSSASRFSSETVFNETEQRERLADSWEEKRFDLTNAERRYRNRVAFWCRKRTEMTQPCVWTCFEEWPISAVRSHRQRRDVTRQSGQGSFIFFGFWWFSVGEVRNSNAKKVEWSLLYADEKWSGVASNDGSDGLLRPSNIHSSSC